MRDIPYEFTEEGEMALGDHLFQGRVIGVYERSERVANHGIVKCSCGYSTGEQIGLMEAQRIADCDHPEGTKDWPGY